MAPPDRLSTGPADRPRDWAGPVYDRISAPQQRWGSAVVDRLDPTGLGTVVDAGCGTGRVTARLLDRLPDATVIGVDGSASMLAQAAHTLAPTIGERRVQLVHADLRHPLPLREGSVDAVVSTATFHWLLDHDALFAHLAAVLRPGGQLVAQCGGAGNIASVVRVLRELGEDWTPWHFATPGETQDRLESHGFEQVRTWAHSEPTTFASRNELEEFLATVVLGPHLERRPPEAGAALVKQVSAGLAEPVIDYVRLNILARRAAAAAAR